MATKNEQDILDQVKRLNEALDHFDNASKNADIASQAQVDAARFAKACGIIVRYERQMLTRHLEKARGVEYAEWNFVVPEREVESARLIVAEYLENK